MRELKLHACNDCFDTCAKFCIRWSVGKQTLLYEVL